MSDKRLSRTPGTHAFLLTPFPSLWLIDGHHCVVLEPPGVNSKIVEVFYHVPSAPPLCAPLERSDFFKT